MRISVNVEMAQIFCAETAAFRNDFLGFIGYHFFNKRKIAINSTIFRVRDPKIEMRKSSLILTAKLKPYADFKMPKKLHMLVLEVGQNVSSVLISKQEASISMCFAEESLREIDLSIEVSVKK
jgi:hypothetical protein